MIRSKFKQAKLQKRLHLTGYKDGQNLIDAYHAMDVFAFASLSETQGIVLTEALAAGVPVVAIDAPGVREVIKNNVNGRLIPKQDQKKFIEALEKCLNLSASHFKILKQRACQSAKEYSIRNSTVRMLKVYKHLVTKNQSSSYKYKSTWQNLGDRIKTDWDIIWNVVKAGEAGVYNRH